MRIRYSRLLPMKGFYALNLFGLVLVRKEYDSPRWRESHFHRKTLNHEAIHTAQMRETLFIGFYIWYLIAWIIRLFTPPVKTAYRDIAFEQEAYANENDFGYLRSRKRYAWLGKVLRTARK